MGKIRGTTFLQAKRKIDKAITYFTGRVNHLEPLDEEDLKHLNDLKDVMKLVEEAAFEQRDYDVGVAKIGNPTAGMFPPLPKKGDKYGD